MPVDPRLQVMLGQAAARAAAAGPGPLPPEVLRAGYRAAILAALGADYAPVPLAEVRDTHAAGVPVRIYRPAAGERLLPAVAFAHAGGWVLGDLETHDEVCRYLSTALPAVVVAVDYRLPPEHVYPAAIEDYWAVVCWLAGHAAELGADPERLVVAGDSAGGNMALAAALRARDAGGPRIRAQAAAYPATDMTLGYGSAPGRSYEKYAEGYGLTAATMSWFAETYLPDPADRAAPDVSPLLAADLSGLPRAVVATAEYDPLSSRAPATPSACARPGSRSSTWTARAWCTAFSTIPGSRGPARPRGRPSPTQSAPPSRKARQAHRREDSMSDDSIEHFNVLVVGAGISGIGVAYHLSHRLAGRRFAVLESGETFGGTWTVNRYPGVRSDSDMYTFGYSFKPWVKDELATAEQIRAYLREVIDENNLDRYIRYRQRVTRLASPPTRAGGRSRSPGWTPVSGSATAPTSSGCARGTTARTRATHRGGRGWSSSAGRSSTR